MLLLIKKVTEIDKRGYAIKLLGHALVGREQVLVREITVCGENAWPLPSLYSTRIVSYIPGVTGHLHQESS